MLQRRLNFGGCVQDSNGILDRTVPLVGSPMQRVAGSQAGTSLHMH